MSKLITAVIYCGLVSALCPLSHAQDAAPAPSRQTAAPKTQTATTRLAASYRQFLDDLQQEKYAEAENQFESLVKLYWSDGFQGYARWQFNIKSNRDQILSALTAATKADPDDPVLQRLLGYVCAIKMLDTTAVSHLNNAISIDPQNAVSFFVRSHCIRNATMSDRKFLFTGSTEQDAKALNDLNEAIRLAPEVSAFYVERARFRVINLRDRTGIEDIDTAVKLDHDPCDALLQRGQLRCLLRDDRRGVEDFSAAVVACQTQLADGTGDDHVNFSKLMPTGSVLFDSYFQRSQAKGRLQDFHGAIADLDAALAANKNFEASFYANRAEMRIGLKDYQAALADFNTASSNGPFSDHDYERRAWVKLQLKDYRGTIDDCNEAIGGRSFAYSEARTYRGIAKYQLGDRDGALTDFEDAIKWDRRSSPDAFIGRGILYVNSNLDLAIADFTEAIERHPKSANAHFQRGLAYHTNKQYDKAIGDFDSVIRLKPDNVAAFFNRGLAERADGQLSTAIASFDAAIKLDPKHHRSYYFRGLSQHDIGDNASAIADYDLVVSIDPEHTNIYLQRAIAKTCQNDFASALADYDEAIKMAIDLDKNSLAAIAGKSFLLSTCSNASLRDPKSASDLANRASAIDPEDPQALNARACSDAATGDFTSAIALEEKALKNTRFANNKDLDGGQFAKERIAAWQANKLWTIPAPANK